MKRGARCGYRTMASTSAFQAEDEGSIPFTRSKSNTVMISVMAVFLRLEECRVQRGEDIRTLCSSCKLDYWRAGYKTISVRAKYKEVCDKCNYRLGWTYILIEPTRYHRERG